MSGRSPRARAKRAARGLADRLLIPYFDRQSAEIAALRSSAPAEGEHATASYDEQPPLLPGSEWPLELVDFNHLLHTLRTVELGRMVRPDRVLLSVGCSDLSYFEWVERGIGPIGEHWGVELYRPRPPKLPANVRWFTASASHMPEIPDASVDVLLSGQNIEHLPVDDLVGFLLEAHRVLRPGGHVVIDSPNRLVTEALTWRHPEHVVEFSPDEAVAMLSLAGFDVTSLRGFWLCAEDDGAVLPLMPEPGDAGELLRRAVLAAPAPDRSFCWWLEARAAEREVDPAALRAHVTQLVAQLWDERVNRGAWRPGARSGADHRLRPDAAGLVHRAGPIPLFAGSTRATAVGDGAHWLTLRLVDDAGVVLGSGPGHTEVHVDETVFGAWVELWCDSPGEHSITVSAIEVRADAITG